MSATSSSAVDRQRLPAFRISDIDPFSIEFFDDPYPTHELLREAGPVVYLDTWNIYGVARYAEVHAVLNDPADLLFQPRRRLERFRQGEAVAAAEHHPRGRPAGAYPDPRGAEPGAVADRDEAAPRPLCRRRGSQGRRVAGAEAASMPLPISPKPIRCRCFPTRSG